MTAAESSSRFARAMSRPGPRLALLGMLILLLLIPLNMIDSRVNERSARGAEAAHSVAASWGAEQTLAGPVLRLPYLYRWTETDKKGRTTEHVRDAGWLWLPPKDLLADVHLRSEVRRRGIFEVPVYTAKLELNGSFVLPDAASLPVAMNLIDTSRAEIVIGVSQPGSLAVESRVIVDARTLALEPSALGLGAPGAQSAEFGNLAALSGVHARVPSGIAADRLAGGVAFEISLELKGSSALLLAPVARDTRVTMRSNWPHPEFRGSALPLGHQISQRGFSAKWSVSHLGRGYPAVWIDQDVSRSQIDDAVFGVALKVPVDPYRMSERIAKYGALLLLLSFAAIWVMELLGGKPLHAVQYLLLGGSLCLFGLLQLALAEHLGFLPAYLLAAAAVVCQAALFARNATGSTRRAAALGGVLSAWFGYLYVVLQAEDLAFLLGALALFAALTGVMWATRGVNWTTGQRGASRWDVADATLG